MGPYRSPYDYSLHVTGGILLSILVYTMVYTGVVDTQRYCARNSQAAGLLHARLARRAYTIPLRVNARVGLSL